MADGRTLTLQEGECRRAPDPEFVELAIEAAGSLAPRGERAPVVELILGKRMTPAPGRWGRGHAFTAYMLMRQLRARALAGTRLAQVTVGAIRLELMENAAQVTVSARRVHVRLCSASPVCDLFAHAHSRLRAASG